MANRRSVATIDSPEFIEIKQISPLISKCEVKVLYVGENRNRSLISKEVATQMAQTLPGCPIVGYFVETKEDFLDHGERVIIDGEGIKFKDMTRPYGFVAPNARIWFQKFEDTDEFGNVEQREYLMTEAYLWTTQYEECKRIMESGNPQSMKLYDETLKGYWSTDKNRGVDFFIINDAMIYNLCILGEDVEPCFEGADITAPKISAKFSKDDNFTTTLFSMMQELKSILQNKGGTTMAIQTIEEEVVTENFSAEQGKVNEEVMTETENITEEFKKAECEGEEKDKAPESKEDAPADNKSEDTSADNKKDEEDNKKKPATDHSLTEYEDGGEAGEGDSDAADGDTQADGTDEQVVAEESTTDTLGAEELAEEEKTFDPAEELKVTSDVPSKTKKIFELEQELAELKNEYTSLQAKCSELEAYKAEIEDAKKDEMIASFYMLNDEDKKDVIENKSKYSLDDIEAKLSIICVKNRVSFDLDSNNTQTAATTFNLNSTEESNLPAWLKAVEDTQKRNK